jgi:hypothetical protein
MALYEGLFCWIKVSAQVLVQPEPWFTFGLVLTNLLTWHVFRLHPCQTGEIFYTLIQKQDQMSHVC